MKTYLFVYLGSLLVAGITTPIVIYIARRVRIYDVPEARKVHSSRIPRIGGIAIFLSAISIIVAVLFLDNHVGQVFRNIQAEVITFLAACTFIFMVGLVDDIHGLRAWVKLVALSGAVTALYVVGVRIDHINLLGSSKVDFGWLSFPITALWIIGISTAVNFIDGLDGLAAGISAVTCAVIGVFAFSRGQLLMVVFMLALLGSLSGFLFFNFNPARIFMGDCGSMFLGFALGSTSVMCAMKSQAIVGLALPALALGLPIFDTFFTLLRRYLARRRILSSDYGHIHHKLLGLGLRHSHAVIAMYGMTLVAVGLGMFMMIARQVGAVVIFFCVLLLFVLVFRLIGVARFHNIIAQLRLNGAKSRKSKQYIDVFENAQLELYRATSLRSFWQVVSKTAEKIGFLEISLTVTAHGGRKHNFTWHSKCNDRPWEEIFSVSLPMNESRFGLPMDVNAKIQLNDSLESAGQCTMLLGRLVDEYSAAYPPAK